jgi:hypothetical protein
MTVDGRNLLRVERSTESQEFWIAPGSHHAIAVDDDDLAVMDHAEARQFGGREKIAGQAFDRITPNLSDVHSVDSKRMRKSPESYRKKTINLRWVGNASAIDFANAQTV